MLDGRQAILANNIFMGCVLGACLFFLPNGVHAATSDSATLEWDANLEPDLAGYRIYHGIAPGIYGLAQTVGKATTYQYPDLALNKTHYFTLTAFDASGNESLPSSEVSKHIADFSASDLMPPSSLTISNLTVASGKTYVVPASGLQVGRTVYIDRAFTFTTVPAGLEGAAYIQTANDDKTAATKTFLSFAVNQPVTVYVGYDLRSNPPPGWLADFTDTGLNLGTTDVPHRLLAKSFSAGTITLGGNRDGGSGNSMYSVIVQPQEGSNPASSTNVFWRKRSSGEVAVWRMNGLTITSVGFPGSASTDWKIEQVGDMNGDGQEDVLWRNSSTGIVGVWLMNEGVMTTSGFLGGVSAEWVIKGIGDMNGDGKADVVWRNSSTGMVAVWLMNGLTITSVEYLGATPLVWKMKQVGDVNGDGKADLVWQNQTSGTVAVWLMNGLTITSVGFPGSAPTGWKIESVGDVNGDGKVDVLWRNTSNGMVAVWLMNGTKMASSGFLGGVPFDWEIKQVSDMNGNGRADVVFQNKTTGMVAVWLMNGLSISSVSYPGSTPVNWIIQR